MSEPYLIGNIVRLSTHIKDEDGILADPTAVILRVKKPDGTIEDLTPTNTAVGKYYYDYTPLKSGDYCYRFEGSGAIVVAVQGKFKVTGKC